MRNSQGQVQLGQSQEKHEQDPGSEPSSCTGGRRLGVVHRGESR